jgi:hypothetical protein
MAEQVGRMERSRMPSRFRARRPRCAQVFGEQRPRRSPAPDLLGLLHLHLLHLGLEHPAGAGGHGPGANHAAAGVAGDDHAGQTAVKVERAVKVPSASTRCAPAAFTS